jgi:hypothetical protein
MQQITIAAIVQYNVIHCIGLNWNWTHMTYV